MDEQGLEQPIPDFIELNAEAMSFTVETSSNTDAGTYTLVMQVTYSNHQDAFRQCETELEVIPVIPTDFLGVVNSKPYFDIQNIEDLSMGIPHH